MVAAAKFWRARRILPLTNVALAIFLLSSFLWPVAVNATEDAKAEYDSIAASKDALSRGSRFPWYDRRQDDVRRLNVVPREAQDDRGVQWTASPTTTAPPKTRTLPRLGLFANF